jgi:hypothetical protein
VVNKADLTVLAYINHLQATEKMYFFWTSGFFLTTAYHPTYMKVVDWMLVPCNYRV